MVGAAPHAVVEGRRQFAIGLLLTFPRRREVPELGALSLGGRLGARRVVDPPARPVEPADPADPAGIAPSLGEGKGPVCARW